MIMNAKNQKSTRMKEPLPVDHTLNKPWRDGAVGYENVELIGDDGSRHPNHAHLNEDGTELVPIEDAYDSAHEDAYQLLKNRLFTLKAYEQQGEDMSELYSAKILIDDRGALDAAVMVVWRLLKDDYGVVDRPAIVDAIATVLSTSARGLSE
jgi:hypothetical protein